jgi:hypothetical protein
VLVGAAILVAAAVVISTARPETTVPHSVERDRAPAHHERDTVRPGTPHAKYQSVHRLEPGAAVLPVSFGGIAPLLVAACATIAARSRTVTRFRAGFGRAPPARHMDAAVA